jgi:tetratricopeptide (TPR) repeat protein
MNFKIDTLKEQAIEAALKGRWLKAIEFNKKTIAQNSEDLDAYLRLGFSYFQIGDLNNAKKTYVRALKIQPASQIALKNLEKIKILKKKSQATIPSTKENRQFFLDPNMFLNSPGKTKVVSLIKLGQINILAKLKIGEKVFLKIKKRRVEIRNKDNEYIGALPDDISKRLILFIKTKAQYSCYIKEVSRKNVDVFIKEEKKGRKLRHYLSFPEDSQDNLKTMLANVEGGETEEEIEGKENASEESPLDIEQLAEEIEEKDFYPETPLEEEDSEFEE